MLQDLYDTWLEICLYGYLYVGPGTIIMLFAEIILQMCVYALYGQTKKMLALLILLTFVLLGFDVIQPFGFPYEAGESICLGGPCKMFGSRKRNLYNQSAGLPCTTLSLPISAVGWLLNSLMELLLFILVLRKCRQAKRHNIVQTSSQTGHRMPQNCDIITIMARDSTAYFAVIFTVCLVGTLLAFATEIRIVDNHVMDFISSQMSTYQTVALTVMMILAPKLLINLRAEYNGRVGAFSDWEKTQMAWNVAAPRHEVDRTLQEPNDSDVRTSLLGTHNRSESETVDLGPQFPNYSDYDSPRGRSPAV